MTDVPTSDVIGLTVCLLVGVAGTWLGRQLVSRAVRRWRKDAYVLLSLCQNVVHPSSLKELFKAKTGRNVSITYVVRLLHRLADRDLVESGYAVLALRLAP